MSLRKWLVGAWAALLVTAAHAAPARADEAEELFRQGRQAEQDLDLGTAARSYEQALALRPGASFAHQARIRLDDLRDHSEGDFRPLERLERVRRSPPLASDPAALAALFEESTAFPPGRVRIEAWMLVAEGFGRRLRRPADAVAPAAALLGDPLTPRPLRARALELLVEAHTALGQHAQAAAALRAHPGLAPALEQRLLRDGRRARLEQLALGGLAAPVGGLLVALWKLRRGEKTWLRRWLVAPTSVAVAVAIGAGGAALGHLFDASSSVRPFVLLAAGVLLVDRCVALARHAFGRAARWPLVVVGLGAVVAVAFLALRLSDASYLESFGL